MNSKIQQLAIDDFRHVVKNTPLVSIDLVIHNDNREMLVGLRKNEPAKGYWFVPGGRILKDETLDKAFQRIIKYELDLNVTREQSEFLGVYEHLYTTNLLSDPDFGTHYVVLAYHLSLNSLDLKSGDDQHESLEWMRLESIIENPMVHTNTQAYAKALLQKGE